MGKDEVLLKKRRKLHASSSSDNSKPMHVDVYKRVINFEESEAQFRSAENDVNLYKKTCHEIRQLFSDIAELKIQDSEEAREKINAKQMEASLHLVTLKKLNRLEKCRTKFGRDALYKEKQRVDSTHLQLQNLLYEADHLNKEVAKCLQFKSRDQDIELIPLDEFYKHAPVEITRPDITQKDEHQLQLARLEWELCQRRELAKACNELVESKDYVAAAIAIARSRIDALAPQLQDLLKATKPLQESLGIPLDDKRNENKLASLLPPPLYLLYANTSAYADAKGTENITVTIAGDENEARRLEQIDGTVEFFLSNDSDSDQDINDEEDKKKRHHRPTKISKEEKAENKKKEVLKFHPLNVQLSIKAPDGTAFNFTFAYLNHLKIVTVKFMVCLPETSSGGSAAIVLDSHNILNGLYYGDSGCDSPHPATTFLLKYAGIAEDFQTFIPELGRPYIWAQRMCGLDFMAMIYDSGQTEKLNQLCPRLSILSVENFIITLKKRLKYRLQLRKELQELEIGKVLMPKKYSIVKLSGSLTQWQLINWSEYSQASSVKVFIDEEMVFPEDMLYRAIITRQSAKLVALVALKNDYPKSMPLFSLTLYWNGIRYAAIDEDIRDIERIINADISLEDNTHVLSVQIAKLMISFDILLETSGSSEFLLDKNILKSVQGRNRAKPYKLLDNGVFIH